MITCRNISKSYRSQAVLEDFSYTFDHTGFYLLFGESGCGKTTLLNILAGYISFDEGKIDFGGEVFESRIPGEKIDWKADYITQDPYFIEYLTLYDNLALCCKDEASIEQYLESFQLSEKKNQYPRQLSGGEKQRACLVRALLQKKHILLLDEPTAALDYDNKILIFQTLAKLKNSTLIICSSHDGEARAYADKCIDFHHLEQYRSLEPDDTSMLEEKQGIQGKQPAKEQRNVKPFIRKWFHSEQKERHSKRRFVMVLMLAVLAVCLGDIPANKIDSSVEYMYGNNQIKVIVPEDRVGDMVSFFDNPNIREVDLIYHLSVPDGISEGDDNIYSDVDYDVTAHTLPADSANFHLQDYLAYGDYFTEENQIILSDAMADKMGNPQGLIGQTLHVKLYDGDYEMEIVGIFRKFTKVEKQYLNASGIIIPDDPSLYDDIFFLNAAFTDRYKQDPEFVSHGFRTYVLYFSSYADMKDYYGGVDSERGIQYIYADIDVSMEFLFVAMFICLFPIALLIMLVSVLFYYQTQKTELMYNRKIFAVYQYLGYDVKKIQRYWLSYSILDFLQIFGTAAVGSALFMVLVNAVNWSVRLIPFQVFSYHVLLLSALAITLLSISIINSAYMLYRLKPENRNQYLLEQRDLL